MLRLSAYQADGIRPLATPLNIRRIYFISCSFAIVVTTIAGDNVEGANDARHIGIASPRDHGH